MYFCDDCNALAHKHKSRTQHKPERCAGPDDTVKLELLSVLCIETSHYVCFTRDPDERWLFFDSMANRLCEYIVQQHVSLPVSVSILYSNT